MAKNLSNTGIVTGQDVEAHHVSQSVDALTGTDAYDITISGSLIVTGSLGVDGPITGSVAAIGTSTITSVGRTTTLENVGGFVSSQGFDSRALSESVYIPIAANWYRILKWEGATRRGGGVVKLSTTGGNFAPATWVINYFKTYGDNPSRHALKLEQYGNTNYITDARIVTESLDNRTYLEVYSPTLSYVLTASCYDDRLLGYNNYTEVFTGTLDATTGTSTTKIELPFIYDGTSVESLHVSGSTILSSGSLSNVGIGTSSPGKKLEVIGDISASGLLYISASRQDQQPYNVLVRDIASGRVYYTGSFEGGSGFIGDLQAVTNNGRITTLPITSSGLFSNGIVEVKPSAISNVQTGIKLIDGSSGASEGLKIEWSNTSDNNTAYINGRSYDKLEFGTDSLTKLSILHSSSISSSLPFTAIHITSSGNISASGFISASEGHFGNSSSTIGDNVITEGHITSSGNISSSGTITGDELLGNSITSVGNISSSAGYIYADAQNISEISHLIGIRTASGQFIRISNPLVTSGTDTTIKDPDVIKLDTPVIEGTNPTTGTTTFSVDTVEGNLKLGTGTIELTGSKGLAKMNQIILNSGSVGAESLGFLSPGDGLQVALSSSDAVYDPQSAMVPNTAMFVTEHGASQLEFAGSGSSINIVSSAQFLNPSLSSKNAVTQLTSIAAVNNTHAANFAVSTRNVSGDVTEKFRISHDGKTSITGSETGGGYGFEVSGSSLFSGSIETIGSATFNQSASFTGLPTTEPITTGSLWISGSSPNHPNSGYLMIFNP